MQECELVDVALMRAAETIGDITPYVIKLLNERCPEAAKTFARHVSGTTLQSLQGSMVEQTVFCLMRYPESPLEIEIILDSTIPNHLEALGVDADLMGAMFQAVHDVVESAIPVEADEERQAWTEVHNRLQAMVSRSIDEHEQTSMRVRAGR